MAKLIYPKPIRFPLWAILKKDPKGLRYSSDFPGKITCPVTEESRLPLVNHIETSGTRASAIISYMADRRRRLRLYIFAAFPQLRVIPNDTRRTLTRSFSPVELKLPEGEGLLSSVSFDGVLSFILTGKGASLTRSFCAAFDKMAVIEKTLVKNTSSKDMIFEIHNKYPFREIPECFTTEGKIPIYTQISINGEEVRGKTARVHLSSGETAVIYAAYSVLHRLKKGETEKQFSLRREFISQMRDKLRITTPDKDINSLLEFCKIRAAESIFDTKNGLMHCPGGGGFYGALWTNDQCEYANPLFAYLGYGRGLKECYDSFTLFSKLVKEDQAVPTSIIACGDGIWNGAGDRGDSSMYLYGLSRYLLTCGSREKAEEFLPYIEKALTYVLSRFDENGIVRSDSDELENRFKSGKANLSTSCITYDAFISLKYLYESLGDREKASILEEKAAELRRGINSYFSANVEGFETYRYCAEEKKLRAWICLPLTVGFTERKDGTVSALLSPKLRKGSRILTKSGIYTYWDRAALYALRGLFRSGEGDRALELLEEYSRERLLGEHAPYPVEAYPEGNGAQLSGESAMYLRIFTEGIAGYRPVGLNEYELSPSLPEKWDFLKIENMTLCGERKDILIERTEGKYSVTVNGVTYKINRGEKLLLRGRE